MPQTKPIVSIENVVASATVNQKMDLNDITRKFPDVEYHPEQFPGLVMRIREPKSPHFGGGFLVPKLLSPHLFSIHLILESCWLQTDHQTVVGNHQAADQPQMCLMFD